MNEENSDQTIPENKLPKKKWVKFEDDLKPSDDNPSSAAHKPAVIDSESVQVNLPSPQKNVNTFSGAILPTESVHINVNHTRATDANNSSSSQNIHMRTIDLHETSNGVSSIQSSNVIRQGFANGDVIVTLLPVNASFPWITPAKFRPELVPEELMAQGLTLTVEDYVHIMEMLTNDLRFTLYNICYKRVLVLWIFTAFVVLLALLFSGVQGLTLFSLGVMWLVLNSAAIFLCMWIKIKLNHNLERCIAQINRHLIRHKIILGLDDRGRISCHKVNLCFIYFDTTDCVKKLQEIIEQEEAAGRIVSRDVPREDRKATRQFQERMDIDDQDIIIQGNNTTRLSRKQDRSMLLLLRYSARWVKYMLRDQLMLNVDGSISYLDRVPARHCATSQCLCQFIEQHLKFKPRGKLTIRQFFDKFCVENLRYWFFIRKPSKNSYFPTIQHFYALLLLRFIENKWIAIGNLMGNNLNPTYITGV